MTTYTYMCDINFMPGFTPKKVDPDAPVNQWGRERNDIQHLSKDVGNKKLLQQTSFTSNERDLLQSLLIEVFYRRHARAFSKFMSVMCLHDPSFAQSALLEAARQGQNDLLKYTLPVAHTHKLIGSMVVASLLGNHLKTAQWIIHGYPTAFKMSHTDLNDVAKKSQPHRVSIFAICVRHGDVDHIVKQIQCTQPRLHTLLMADWVLAKQRVLVEDTPSLRCAPPRKI